MLTRARRYFSPDDTGLLRILEENEWRGIGITQSLGWEHFEVHGECAGYSSTGCEGVLRGGLGNVSGGNVESRGSIAG
jgi:hypothetical protein